MPPNLWPNPPPAQKPNGPNGKLKVTLKIGFVSLGCPKNLVDSEVMMGDLVSKGHELTPHPDEADVIVVNTCSFIDPAKKESIDTILEMAQYKETGRAQRLIVAGCLVERHRADIVANMPEVDAVIGTNELANIAALCEGLEPAAHPVSPFLYHEGSPRVRTTPKHHAYIKIAEGCDHPCTFCIIPQFRGQFRSRRFEGVILEARRANPTDPFWALCFGRRPAIEFYNLVTDRDCVNNLANSTSTATPRLVLKTRMEAELKGQGDPRMFGQGAVFDRYPHSNATNVNFYERFMRGDKVSAGWVNPTDFETAPLD